MSEYFRGNQVMSSRRWMEVQPEANQHYWNRCGSDWSIIKPAGWDVTNHVRNPSFEEGVIGTTEGWHSPNALFNLILAGHYGQSAGLVTPVFPSGALNVAYYSNHLSGPGSPFPPMQFTTGSTGKNIYASITVTGSYGDSIIVRFFRDGAGASLRDPGTLVLATGLPQRVFHKYHIPATTTPVVHSIGLLIESDNYVDKNTLIIDGAVVTEDHPAYLYFDGDSPDAVWNGQAHKSTSTISANAIGVGEKISFADLGFDIIEVQGDGQPPSENIATPFARQPGSFWQGTRINPRLISFTGVLNSCSGKRGLMEKRKSLLSSFHGRFKQICDQPLYLHFEAVDDCCHPISQPLLLEAIYETGAAGIRRGIGDERMTLQFTAHQHPFFFSPYHKTQLLPVPTAPSTSTTSVVSTASEPCDPEIYIPALIAPVTILGMYNDTTGGILTIGPGSPNTGIVIPTGYELHVLPNAGLAKIRPMPGTSGVVTDVSSQVRWLESNIAAWVIIPGENKIRVLKDAAVTTGAFVSYQAHETSSDYAELFGSGENCRPEPVRSRFVTSPF